MGHRILEADHSAATDRLTRIDEILRDMGEERDLVGLAGVAAASLRTLRQLVERPATCSELDDMLARLERLSLDTWETDE